jgi:quercetin dioxygenase-like cupin family protein
MSTATIPATFEHFTADATARGYDQTLVREWEPNQVMAEHVHPFDTSAVVVRGEFWLTCEGQTRHLKVGDAFQVARDIPHDEKYGPEGATFWAARKN